jgi:hypothetical protein
MTEVIRMTKDRPGDQPGPSHSAETDSEEPQSREVIRVGTPRVSESTSLKPGASESRGAHAIKVGGIARASEAPEPMADHAPQLKAEQLKVEHQLKDVAAIAAAFAEGLKALDSVAAEQARWLAAIAVDLAEAAVAGRALSHRHMAGDNTGQSSAENRIEMFMANLREATDAQMKALATAQASLLEASTGSHQDQRRHSGSTLDMTSADPGRVALANMISNLNLAQQNAVANQHSMNTTAQAAIAAGVSLLYSTSEQGPPSEE